MAINYADKFSTKVDEAFVHASKTNDIVNQDYDFIGVDTVKVYSYDISTLNDYSRTGNARYGTANELNNEVEEMQITQDKSFTFTIDRANRDDTMMTNEAGKMLRRHIDELIVPTVDKYRLATIVAKAGTVVTGAITTANAYESIVDANLKLTDLAIPEAGRVLEASPEFYKKIKMDTNFIKPSDVAQNMLISGSLGMVDGLNIKLLPSSYLPAGVEFVVTHKIATTSPIKLQDYKIHENPPGISGWLVEGRFRYDAFVLKHKTKAIYVHKSA